MRYLWMVVVMAGCGALPLPGAPQLGTACDATSVMECYSQEEIAFCNSGKWDAYPCTARCSNEQKPRCTIRMTAGDTCPASWEGAGGCVDGVTQALCEGGKWVHHSCGQCDQQSWGSSCR